MGAPSSRLRDGTESGWKCIGLASGECILPPGGAYSMTEMPSGGTSYEPPRIEAVFTAEDLEREVLYAGQGSFPA
jgi:hypothetical protein